MPRVDERLGLLTGRLVDSSPGQTWIRPMDAAVPEHDGGDLALLAAASDRPGVMVHHRAPEYVTGGRCAPWNLEASLSPHRTDGSPALARELAEAPALSLGGAAYDAEGREIVVRTPAIHI